MGPPRAMTISNQSSGHRERVARSWRTYLPTSVHGSGASDAAARRRIQRSRCPASWDWTARPRPADLKAADTCRVATNALAAAHRRCQRRVVLRDHGWVEVGGEQRVGVVVLHPLRMGVHGLVFRRSEHWRPGVDEVGQAVRREHRWMPQRAAGAAVHVPERRIGSEGEVSRLLRRR